MGELRYEVISNSNFNDVRGEILSTIQAGGDGRILQSSFNLWREIRPREEHALIIGAFACDEDQKAGFSGAIIDSGGIIRASVTVVKHEYRGRGCAKRLIALKTKESFKHTDIFVTNTSTRNEKMKKILRELGFKPKIQINNFIVYEASGINEEMEKLVKECTGTKFFYII